jgi:hypothetical protein
MEHLSSNSLGVALEARSLAPDVVLKRWFLLSLLVSTWFEHNGSPSRVRGHMRAPLTFFLARFSAPRCLTS